MKNAKVNILSLMLITFLYCVCIYVSQFLLWGFLEHSPGSCSILSNYGTLIQSYILQVSAFPFPISLGNYSFCGSHPFYCLTAHGFTMSVPFVVLLLWIHSKLSSPKQKKLYLILIGLFVSILYYIFFCWWAGSALGDKGIDKLLDDQAFPAAVMTWTLLWGIKYILGPLFPVPYSLLWGYATAYGVRWFWRHWRGDRDNVEKKSDEQEL